MTSRITVPRVAGLLAAATLLAAAGLPSAAADSPQPPVAETSSSPDAREFLRLLGIDESHFQKFSDGQPVGGGGEREALAELLFAVRRIPPQFAERWARQTGDFDWETFAKKSPTRRGQFFGLRGHVTKVTEQRPPAELAQRLDLKGFYRCECEVGDRASPAVVYAVAVPLEWPADNAIREPVSFQGVYFKLSAGGLSNPSTPTFAATRLAWHPEGLLGRLGLDVGLLEGVRHNRDLSGPSDKEAFYQLLAGAGHLPAAEMDAAAGQALAELGDPPRKPGEESRFSIPKIFEHAKQVDALRREADDLTQLGERADRVLDLTRQKNAARTEAERAAVASDLSEALAEFQAKAQVVNVPVDVAAVLTDLDAWIQDRLAGLRQRLSAAADSPYSQGRPMTFEGTARRAVRVLVDDPALAERLGFDHYYLVEMMVDLGQRARLADGSLGDDTLVIAQLRELPAGMPQGQKINARVRLSGVFLKLYPYVPEKAERSGSDERHLAPLLIGRELTWIRYDQQGHYQFAAIATGLFLLLLGGIVFWSWRTRRADARARAKMAGRLAASGPSGSLDDLKLD